MVHGRSPKVLHLLINRVHTGGTAVCNSNRSISIRDQCRQIIVAIACSLIAPFYHLKRRLCSGFSNVCIFQGWIGNSRVTCSGCSLDRLVISMLCRPHRRQVTLVSVSNSVARTTGNDTETSLRWVRRGRAWRRGRRPARRSSRSPVRPAGGGRRRPRSSGR